MVDDKKFTVLFAFADKDISKKLEHTFKGKELFISATIKSNFLEIDRSIQKNCYDLILADIEFGTGENTRTIFEILKDRKHHPPIILFSHKKKWAAKAFYYGALDYIVYPLRPPRITKALNRYLQLVNARVSQSILNRRLVLNQRGNQIFLDFKDIIFIKSQGKKSIVHTAKEQYEFFILLKDLETLLAKLGFIRLHKRYIVNRYYIKSFNQSGERDKVARIHHPEVEYVPIGRSYYKNLDPCEFSITVR